MRHFLAAVLVGASQGCADALPDRGAEQASEEVAAANSTPAAAGSAAFAEIDPTLVTRAIALMDPYIFDDGVNLELDREGLADELEATEEFDTALALRGEGEPTPLGDAIEALARGLPDAEAARDQLASGDLAFFGDVRVDWSWSGLTVWFTGSDASAAAVAFKSATAVSLAGVAGVVGYLTGGVAGVVAGAIAAALGPVADAYIDSCASDGEIGLRVYFIGGFEIAC